MSILNNTTNLQSLLEQANSLPEASGGVELPTLSNEGTAGDLLSGKQLIDSDGNVVTGTIATKTSNNLTASGATVTVPAGYYASNASKSVNTATQATPSVSIDSAGKITASATQTAGYVSAGTKTGTKQLTIQAAKTVTPTESSQTAVAKNVYTTGAVTVGPIPDGYLVGDEIEEQEDLLTELENVLAGKAAGEGGIDTSDATAEASDILAGETAYVNGNKVTGTMPTQTLPTPTIEVSSAGLITAKDTMSISGYVVSGTKSATKQLTIQAAKTITPSTSSQTAVASGRYTTGAVTVAAVSTQTKTVTPSATTQNVTPDSGKFLSNVTVNGDSNLVAGNIKSGVSIFGVSGSYQGSGSGDEDDPAGSGSYKTCTLTYYDVWSETFYYPLYYTTVENGEIVFKTTDAGADISSITVLCDSIIFYEVNESMSGSFETTGGFEILYDMNGKYTVIKAPSTAGATGEIIYPEDTIPDID